MNAHNAHPEQSKLALAWGQLSEEQLRATLAQVLEAVTGFDYFIGYTVESYHWHRFSPSVDPGQFLEGRVFSEAGQLRWRAESWMTGAGAREAGWRAVYVGGLAAEPEALAPDRMLELTGPAWSLRRSEVLLRGQRRSGQSVWMEPRIPGPIEYPWEEEGERLVLCINEYQRRGRTEFHQFCGLRAWGGADR